MIWLANKFAIWYFSGSQSRNEWVRKEENRATCVHIMYIYCDLFHAKMKINSCYFEFHSIAFFIRELLHLTIDWWAQVIHTHKQYRCTLMILLIFFVYICSLFTSFSLWVNAAMLHTQARHNGNTLLKKRYFDSKWCVCVCASVRLLHLV